MTSVYNNKVGDQAEEAFANHEITASDDRSWLIQKRTKKDGLLTGVHAAEVISSRRGELVVVGDIDTVVFAYSNTPPRSRVAWIGNRSRVCSYVLSKANIGTGFPMTKYDEVQAVVDLDDMIANHCDASKDKLVELRDSIRDSYVEEHEARQALYDIDGDGERAGTLGDVYCSRLHYAHAAVRRLHLLLCGDEPGRPNL